MSSTTHLCTRSLISTASFSPCRLPRDAPCKDLDEELRHGPLLPRRCRLLPLPPASRARHQPPLGEHDDVSLLPVACSSRSQGMSPRCRPRVAIAGAPPWSPCPWRARGVRVHALGAF